MRVFLLVYFTTYGILHAYFVWKVRQGFPQTRRPLIAAAAWSALMILAPILTRALENPDREWPARVFAYVGHPWFAIILWFFTLGILLETWNLALRLTAKAWPAARPLALGPRPALAALALAVVLASTWGIIEASQIRLKQIRIKTHRLPPGASPLRLVQITDLHLSYTVGEGRLAKVIEIIRAARPDVLVCTGDFCDLKFERGRELAAMLDELRPPLGKFAIFGNHEFYTGADESLRFLHAAGFRPLRQEAVPVGESLLIAGVDDASGRRRGLGESLSDEGAALPNPRSDRFTVLLKHRPAVQPESARRFDLQLSGHSHGGQIAPFNLIVNLVYPLETGLHQLPGSAAVYVSPGTGTWGPPMRLLVPPEVTLFLLEPAETR